MTKMKYIKYKFLSKKSFDMKKYNNKYKNIIFLKKNLIAFYMKLIQINIKFL